MEYVTEQFLNELSDTSKKWVRRGVGAAVTGAAITGTYLLGRKGVRGIKSLRQGFAKSTARAAAAERSPEVRKLMDELEGVIKKKGDLIERHRTIEKASKGVKGFEDASKKRLENISNLKQKETELHNKIDELTYKTED
jgi:predicted  nucleic acid-binding Zn-ribbon protein